MTTHLLTILGKGTRFRVRYDIDGTPSPPTASIDAALVRHFDVREVLALGTTDARAEAKELRQKLGEGTWAEDRITLHDAVHIDDGRSTPQFWQIFDTVRALYAQLCDRSDPAQDVVLVNLTHGFRTQPMIAQAAVLFEAAERRRNERPRIPTRLLYGAAFLPDNAGQLPADTIHDGAVWDMTNILEAGEWSTAIGALRDHAQADLLEEKLEELGSRFPKGTTSFTPLGKATRQLVDMLVTGRTRFMPEYPKRFLSLWQEVHPQLAQQLPPVVDGLKGFADVVQHFVTPSVASQAGVDAAFAAAEWLIRTGQYASATALMRETTVTRAAVQAGEPAGHEPGPPFRRRERQRVERRLTRDGGRKSTWDRLTSLRNDVLHAGYSDSPRGNGTELRDACADLLTELRSQPPPAPRPRGDLPVLLNLTAAPSSTWDSRQTAAALEFASGIEDLPIPDVAPDAEVEDVYELANACVRDVEQHGSAIVLVQGEHTLTTTIVQLLQEARVTCLAAVSAPVADASAPLQFTRFRTYPSLRR